MRKIYNGHVIPAKVIRNHNFRMKTVLGVLKKYKPESVLDIGSGDGQFIDFIKKESWLKKITGIEIDRNYFKASKKIIKTKEDEQRITLKNISLFDLSESFIKKYTRIDALVMVEVIEHIPPKDIPKLNNILFKILQPKLVIITTPNAVFRLSQEELDRFDHKFEWDEKECRTWGEAVGKKYGYTATHHLVKRRAKEVKRGSQMYVFTKN